MNPSRSVRTFAWVSFALGTAARVIPLFDPTGRGLRQFPSEDGYLMLTISRNLAAGNGLSIEAGETVTNGTQPLMTFLYGALFWLVGGDRTWGVLLSQVLGLVIAVCAALLLHRLARAALGTHPRAEALALFVAATWYVSPLSTRFTQNCLETGAATLVPMGLGLLLLRRHLSFDRAWPLRLCVLIGVLLGIAFWIRNDAVLQSVALCSALVVSGVVVERSLFGRRIVEAGVVGVTALLVVSPWLIYNHLLFDSIVPVSGISQAAEGFAENAARIPAILAEQISLVGLIPAPLETHPAVLVLASLAVLAWLGLVIHEARSLDSRRQQLLVLLGLWALLHVGFYGLIYGAGYFVGRYLFPLGTWAALLTVWLGYRLWVRAGEPKPRLATLAPMLVVLALATGLDIRMYVRGTNNGHFQIIEWVEEHVPEDTWVAAIQTGTLGFFHDNTYNLDGKVSPPALRAKLEGRTFDYVLARPIRYLVDWVGIAEWLEDPDFERHFEMLVFDEERNLAVLRRRDP